MSLRIAYLGTYDPGYPRNRVLIDGLRAAGAEVLEYAAPLDASSATRAAALPAPGSRPAVVEQTASPRVPTRPAP